MTAVTIRVTSTSPSFIDPPYRLFRPPYAGGPATPQRRGRFPSPLASSRSHSELAATRSVSIDRRSTLRFRKLSVAASGERSHRGKNDWNLNQISHAPYSTP